jgi:hypothetical protein
MRAAKATGNSPYPIRALAEQLRAVGDQGYALADNAMKIAEERAERN